MNTVEQIALQQVENKLKHILEIVSGKNEQEIIRDLSIIKQDAKMGLHCIKAIFDNN